MHLVGPPDGAGRGAGFAFGQDRRHQPGMLGRDTLADKRFRNWLPSLDRRRIKRIRHLGISTVSASDDSLRSRRRVRAARAVSGTAVAHRQSTTSPERTGVGETKRQAVRHTRVATTRTERTARPHRLSDSRHRVACAMATSMAHGHNHAMEEGRPRTDFITHRGAPAAVARPTSNDQVVELLRYATKHGVAIVPRGTATNLSAAIAPGDDSLVLDLTSMNRIVEIDAEGRRAVVEPGVINADLKAAAAPLGLAYAPDPASTPISTIGGNIAENAGGPGCIKYGVTFHHVLAARRRARRWPASHLQRG